MSDVDRRGEENEHAWAELTWINLFKLLVLAWLVGVVCGCGFFAVGVYTTVYQGALSSLASFAIANPFLVVGIGLGMALILYVGVRVDRAGRKRKPAQPVIK